MLSSILLEMNFATPLGLFNSPYSIRVRSTDNKGSSTEKAFQITVTPEGDIQPTDISLAQLTSLFENMPVSNSSGWNGLFSTTDASIADSPAPTRLLKAQATTTMMLSRLLVVNSSRHAALIMKLKIRYRYEFEAPTQAISLLKKYSHLM